MTDRRVADAQQLFWEVRGLRQLGADRKSIVPKLAQMATLHEERARELLAGARPDGWVDLLAAVTAWGEAGEDHRARSLLSWGRGRIACFEGPASLEDELERMEGWLGELTVVPALADFARFKPSYGPEAA